MEVYNENDEMLSMLTDGIAGLMSLDTEEEVLRNALNLCMAISKSSSGCIIWQTEEDMWKINETHHNIYIPSDLISNMFREGTFHINHEMTCLLPPELRGTVNTVIPINVDGSIHTALLFHNDNNTRAFFLLSLFLSSFLSRLKILKEIEGMKINAAGLAHEIRNPLVSIKTLAQLLPERYDDQEFRYQFTNVAINEIDRINNIVSDLLDFTKTSEPNFTLVDIQAVIDEVLALLYTRFEECGILISRNYLAQVPAIYGDSAQLKQIFLNIFLNSHEAIQKGGRISVDLTVGKDGDEIKKIIIEITDTGSGIEKDTMQHVFEPFFTTKDKGTGLGLSICKRMISNHRGNIFLNSIDKQGTTVTIELPVNNAT